MPQMTLWIDGAFLMCRMPDGAVIVLYRYPADDFSVDAPHADDEYWENDWDCGV